MKREKGFMKHILEEYCQKKEFYEQVDRKFKWEALAAVQLTAKGVHASVSMIQALIEQ